PGPAGGPGGSIRQAEHDSVDRAEVDRMNVERLKWSAGAKGLQELRERISQDRILALALVRPLQQAHLFAADERSLDVRPLQGAEDSAEIASARAAGGFALATQPEQHASAALRLRSRTQCEQGSMRIRRRRGKQRDRLEVWLARFAFCRRQRQISLEYAHQPARRSGTRGEDPQLASR